MVSRRNCIAGMMATAGALAVRSRGIEALATPPTFAVRPAGVLIESHVHLFSDDPARFPLRQIVVQAKACPGRLVCQFRNGSAD